VASRKSEAEAFRTAYGAGLVRRSEVIDWADRIIAHDEHPEPAICDIATASRVDASEFFALLDAVPGTPDPKEVASLLLGRLRELRSKASMTASQVAHALYELAQHDRSAFSEDDRARMLCFEDAFELAAAGAFRELASVTAEIDAFLQSRH
jgi:hypothetical protein